MVALRGELQPVVDLARQRMRGLQAEIGAGRDGTGHKARELKRLQLYTQVVKRVTREGALMPELIHANKRGLFRV